MKYHCHSS